VVFLEELKLSLLLLVLEDFHNLRHQADFSLRTQWEVEDPLVKLRVYFQVLHQQIHQALIKVALAYSEATQVASLPKISNLKTYLLDSSNNLSNNSLNNHLVEAAFQAPEALKVVFFPPIKHQLQDLINKPRYLVEEVNNKILEIVLHRHHCNLNHSNLGKV
jgi:hypothetical protein